MRRPPLRREGKEGRGRRASHPRSAGHTGWWWERDRVVTVPFSENVDNLLKHFWVLKKTTNVVKPWNVIIKTINIERRCQSAYSNNNNKNKRSKTLLCAAHHHRHPGATTSWRTVPPRGAARVWSATHLGIPLNGKYGITLAIARASGPFY